MRRTRTLLGLLVGVVLLSPNPNQIFTIVIWGNNWGNNRSKFWKPEDDFNGKRVCVTGKITAYAGLLEIVAGEPKQIAAQTTK